MRKSEALKFGRLEARRIGRAQANIAITNSQSFQYSKGWAKAYQVRQVLKAIERKELENEKGQR